jgi:hypothetical protein
MDLFLGEYGLQWNAEEASVYLFIGKSRAEEEEKEYIVLCFPLQVALTSQGQNGKLANLRLSTSDEPSQAAAWI